MIELLLALLKGLLGKIVTEEFGAACQSLARWLVQRSAARLIEDKERYLEQWLADLEDRKTPIRRVVFALGVVRAAVLLRRDSGLVCTAGDKEFGGATLSEGFVYMDEETFRKLQETPDGTEALRGARPHFFEVTVKPSREPKCVSVILSFRGSSNELRERLQRLDLMVRRISDK